ncbi:hypothetical protein VDG1235_787 [Verrucomicrobiia bacterium DG1235]|nr:hypothetical protein VDG1235_787 [Verrucomicrobiae bacterium DG1235]
MKGTPITADDLKDIEVKTFSPFAQGMYFLAGIAFTVFGIWAHNQTRNMVHSFPLVLFGVAHCVYAGWGRPRKVRDMESELNLMDLTTEIVTRFVGEMESKRKDAK